MGFDLGSLMGTAAAANPYSAGISAVSGLASGGPSSSGDASSGDVQAGGISSPIVIGGFKSDGSAVAGIGSVPLWAIIAVLALGALYVLRAR
jgi:hypothetical protein